jgi:hypothetical protein
VEQKLYMMEATELGSLDILEVRIHDLQIFNDSFMHAEPAPHEVQKIR